jgi:hypothetical protein
VSLNHFWFTKHSFPEHVLVSVISVKWFEAQCFMNPLWCGIWIHIWQKFYPKSQVPIHIISRLPIFPPSLQAYSLYPCDETCHSPSKTNLGKRLWTEALAIVRSQLRIITKSALDVLDSGFFCLFVFLGFFVVVFYLFHQVISIIIWKVAFLEFVSFPKMGLTIDKGIGVGRGPL